MILRFRAFLIGAALCATIGTSSHLRQHHNPGQFRRLVLQQPDRPLLLLLSRPGQRPRRPGGAPLRPAPRGARPHLRDDVRVGLAADLRPRRAPAADDHRGLLLRDAGERLGRPHPAAGPRVDRSQRGGGDPRVLRGTAAGGGNSLGRMDGIGVGLAPVPAVPAPGLHLPDGAAAQAVDPGGTPALPR